MIIEIKIPTPGESITEVELGKWLVEDGDTVDKDQEIAEIESDKATLTLVASEAGKIKIQVGEGEAVPVGAIACTIDTEAGDVQLSAVKKEKAGTPEIEEKPAETKAVKEKTGSDQPKVKTTAVAQKMMEENNLSVDDIIRGLQRIGKKEVEAVLHLPEETKSSFVSKPAAFSREEKREKMSLLRRKLSERLVSVKNETAMLTTFNEVDMSRVMEIRKQYQTKFVEQHGFKLGFMSFFTKAVAMAMQFHPTVNSMIDGDEVLTPDFVDVGIAVQTPKGLMVPIVRNVESKSIPSIELEIKELAEKARNKMISVEELTGGTFTITNGGTFGSLLSTPIINPPQSAILGMHNIVDRPVAVDGQVVIRPMMYVALSYDHRVIDGKDSVGFLVKLKELLEHPERLLTNGKTPEALLLEL
ncbi:2-oxoglutarate dehydrogenase complex dihydrolipoyllysine-residue succinyltransferase [Gaoshiqia sediminis]|uniref:Dihydrolipoyllysine-residue succinyltransferase n=1 Tax=Gaoshiqia sediminis TaxID=2986998 RepID=A0AA41Y5A5_9BACT|nr:2-oxoglutarate dehydrogenase complex dihydrolipoyllysine-residue succinyltransferase [Gaoshiqia sediminis]MCW0482115.1 2-oxoglutarate dehydrogenase complex dihydrolipoyllysine-residue succinyltransferase [Gaoshiqia sediminis]